MNYERIRLPIFTPGKEVTYQNRTRVVEYTIISKGILFVKLYNVYDIVDSKEIICEDSVYEYQIKEGRIIAKT